MMHLYIVDLFSVQFTYEVLLKVSIFGWRLLLDKLQLRRLYSTKALSIITMRVDVCFALGRKSILIISSLIAKLLIKSGFTYLVGWAQVL
jgi:hypothetical protein